MDGCVAERLPGGPPYGGEHVETIADRVRRARAEVLARAISQTSKRQGCSHGFGFEPEITIKLANANPHPRNSRQVWRVVTLDAFAKAPNFKRRMADTIRTYIGRNVLEIGAGMGNPTRPLLPGRKRQVASDIDREHLERLKNRLSQRRNLEIAELNAALVKVVPLYHPENQTEPHEERNPSIRVAGHADQIVLQARQGFPCGHARRAAW